MSPPMSSVVVGAWVQNLFASTNVKVTITNEPPTCTEKQGAHIPVHNNVDTDSKCTAIAYVKECFTELTACERSFEANAQALNNKATSMGCCSDQSLTLTYKSMGIAIDENGVLAMGVMATAAGMQCGMIILVMGVHMSQACNGETSEPQHSGHEKQVALAGGQIMSDAMSQFLKVTVADEAAATGHGMAKKGDVMGLAVNTKTLDAKDSLASLAD